MFSRVFLFLSITVCLTFISCRPSVPPVGDFETVVVKDSDLALEDHGDRAHLAQALEFQINYFKNKRSRTPKASLSVYGRRLSYAQLIDAYQNLVDFLQNTPTPLELSDYLTSHFEIAPYRSRRRDGQLLVTGYFVPAYKASREATPLYRYPLYPPPKDRRKYTRDQIDYRNALQGKVKPIAWMESEIDRFFLHVQGSGVLQFSDGSNMAVGYAGNNGYDYVSLGALLIRDGILEKQGVSMQTIRDYFEKRPKAFRKYAKRLRRYIYFIKKDQARGALGFPVTPLRTVAADPQVLPLGLLAHLQTSKPYPGMESYKRDGTPLHLLVLLQDKGGGIKGDHIDLFWGSGQEALDYAGHMKTGGLLQLLLPK